MEPCCQSFELVEARDFFAPQKLRLPDHNLAARNIPEHAASRRSAEVGGWQKRDILRATHNRIREGMLAALLEGSRKLEQFFRIHAIDGNYVHKLGASLGEGAGFIYHQSRDFFQLLECSGILHQHALAGTAPHGDHDGHGCGKAQCARAGDQENGYSIHDGMGESRLGAEQAPREKCDNRNRQHDWNKNSSDFVGKTLNRRACALGFRDALHNAAEQGFSTNPLGAHHECPRAIQSAGRNLVARAFFYWHRLASDHRLIDARVAFDQNAIHRHAAARRHAQAVARLNLREGNLQISGIRKLERNGRSEIQQSADCAACSGPCAQLEHLSQKNECDNHRSRLEVNRHLPAMSQRMGKKIRNQYGRRAHQKSGAHSKRNEREHIPMPA